MASLPESLTTKGLGVDFYCRNCTSAEVAEHIRAACDLLIEAAFASPHRLKDPWGLAHLRGEFRQRLEQATKGELYPEKDCKPLGDGALPLYEIRWRGLRVKESAAGLGEVPVSVQIEVRLIHAEPTAHPYVVVALHAHQKVIIDDDPRQTRVLQDEEIRVAVAMYIDDEDVMWGVSLRPRPAPPDTEV